ncbi:SPOR domain-containing protein [Pseudoalteromonas prydzensis]|uniref:SPOR domain-containing protein n=1 Tax=Pseudoalteromonas prydzensis TaxID=182141 RepID=UPI0007E510D9|nr:SPOR domain-containing protein [Pseudoalteromonas prydzensis]MBE0376069.1 hypothetical protein [Pseudoalteromonas prydzensis ACAM 620]
MNIKQPVAMITAMLFAFTVVGLVGCKSTETETQNAQMTTTDQYVQITKQELQQLQTSSAQWQTIKPDIERLLLIESDLNLLIAQLTAIANEDQTESSAPAASQQQSPVHKAELAPMASGDLQALFALQIVSVTQQAQLATSWQAIQQKAPSLVTTSAITNVETAQVKGTTYYRLKLGAYQYQKNAQADCDKLKQQQLNCMVTHYTDNPIKL